MKWVETIRLCTAADRRARAVESTREAVAGIELAPPLTGVSVYRHVALSTDLIVLLRFESTEHQPRTSDLAIRLSSALQELGLVERSCWIEVQARGERE